MRNRVNLTAVLAAVLLAGLTCSIPSDIAQGIYVSVEAPALVLLDGDEMTIRARVWRTVGGVPDSGNGDDEEVVNVDVVWDPGNASVVRVDKDIQGYAVVAGLNPGQADITARVLSFEGVVEGLLPLRVSGLLEIDSVTPGFVRWGDKVTLWGVGVQFADAGLLGQSLIPDTLTFTESSGFSHMEYWVPQPARTSQPFVIGPGIFFTVPTMITVDTIDLYEPNTTFPALVDLNGPGPYPVKAPSVLFLNPALAFEELPRDTVLGFDWYRFARSDTASPLTIILRPQGLTDSSSLFIVVTDSVIFNGAQHSPGPSPTWFITSQGGMVCSKGGFFPFIQTTDSMVLALKTRPRYVPGNDGLHLLTFYGNRFNYAVAVVQAYLTSDPRLQPDRFEENDICDLADAPAKLVTVNPLAAFGDTLNIDNPHDPDWIRFSVNAPLATDSTMIRVRSRPFGAVALDRSDVDLYVLDANTLFEYGSVASVGSDDSMRLQLPTGDYYLAIVDFAGEPIRYSVCIAVRFGCTPTASAAGGATNRPRGERFRNIGAGRLQPNGRPFAAPARSAIDLMRT
ncbi:MAG: hypothetical protein ACREMF_06500, partial [Gemmatimonadales bacterium]